MKLFSELFYKLDSTKKINTKINFLVDYFKKIDKKDLSWSIFFLFGERIPRVSSPKEIRSWVSQESNIPLWLVEESYHFVGDLAETASLLFTNQDNLKKNYYNKKLSELIEEDLIPLVKKEESVRKEIIVNIWNGFQQQERLLLNKLLTGGLRIGVSKKIVIKALVILFKSDYPSISEEEFSVKLFGKWIPNEESINKLLSSSDDNNYPLPLPFSLASSFDQSATDLGDIKNWQVEWKWDGIRAQIIKNNDIVTIWSRGEEVINESFSDLVEIIKKINTNSFIIDCEIVSWDIENKRPASFSSLQKRLGKKNLSKKFILNNPVKIISYDLLYYNNSKVVDYTLKRRRELLEILVNDQIKNENILCSEVIEFDNFEDLVTLREKSREYNSEGLMLKKLDSSYVFGRKRGGWWKWKVDPYTFDLVLLYAQRGHGRRAGLYTDFTLGIWNEDRKLVPITKAYSGLTDLEMKEINSFIRANTIEKFGPTVQVKPHYVFEISCEGINKSPRHKIGYAFRFPRITKIRTDKKPEDADTIEIIRKMPLEF